MISGAVGKPLETVAKKAALTCSDCNKCTNSNNAVFQYSCPKSPMLPLSVTSYGWKPRSKWPCSIVLGIYIELFIAVCIAAALVAPAIIFTVFKKDYTYFPGSLSNTFYQYRWGVELEPNTPKKFRPIDKWCLGLLQFPIGIGLAIEFNKHATQATISTCSGDNGAYTALWGELWNNVFFNFWAFLICYLTFASILLECLFFIFCVKKPCAQHCFPLLALTPPFCCGEHYDSKPDQPAGCCTPEGWYYKCYAWLYNWSSKGANDFARDKLPCYKHCQDAITAILKGPLKLVMGILKGVIGTLKACVMMVCKKKKGALGDKDAEAEKGVAASAGSIELGEAVCKSCGTPSEAGKPNCSNCGSKLS